MGCSLTHPWLSFDAVSALIEDESIWNKVHCLVSYKYRLEWGGWCPRFICLSLDYFGKYLYHIKKKSRDFVIYSVHILWEEYTTFCESVFKKLGYLQYTYSAFHTLQ